MWRLEDNKKMAHLLQSSTPVPLEDAEIVPIPEKQPSREEWEDTYVFLRKISDNRFLAVKLTDIIRRSKQMIEWINPEDRLPEEYHPVLVKIGGDVHVAHIVEKISLTGPGENFWFADDTIMIWPAEDASCWAEIPNVQKDTNSAKSKPE